MISVIIPVYNCEKYIERCVESIISQRNGIVDVEIVLVDDGSTDNSYNVCQTLKKSYPDSIVLIHKNNGGVSSARNEGMKVAHGDYFFFVDADDVVTEKSLQLLLGLTEKKAQLYMGEVWIYGAKRQILYAKKGSYSKNSFIYEILTEGATELLASGVWGKLFLSDIIKNNGLFFDESYQNGEDGLFLAEYLKYVSKVEVAEGELPVYKLFRYEEGERQSAVSYFYPDLYLFFFKHRKLLYEQIENDETVNYKEIHQHYINDMIVLLVRAFAFPEFFASGELREMLRKILKDSIVLKAGKDYKRLARGTSILIPLGIKYKNLLLLESQLRKRGRKYRMNRYRGEKLRSVRRIIQ